MGVFGLMGYLLDNQENTGEVVDLVTISRQLGGIEILTDFYSFEHFVMEHFWKNLVLVYGNEYLPILGGEYVSMDMFFSKLIENLKNVGITMVFFIDGARGSSREQTRQKMQTWQSRHVQEVRRLQNVLDVCRGLSSMGELDESHFVRPVLLETQILITLRTCGCEVIQCPYGEADQEIASAFASRPHAYCIFSSDTDFCVFPECRMLMGKLFDMENNLGLGLHSEIPMKPERLVCRVFTTKKLMQSLGVLQHDQLVEACTLNGNDFTSHYVKRLHNQIGLGNCRLPQIVQWIWQHGKMDTHPILAEKMRRDSGFRSAMEYSRLFYSQMYKPGCGPDQGGDHKQGYIASLMEENVRNRTFPPSFIGIRNGFYWFRHLVEDVGPGLPCTEVALRPLRQAVYRMLLAPHHNHVVEYGRSSYEEFHVSEVMALHDSFLPSVHLIRADQVFRNLRIFHHVMSHQEPTTSDQIRNWFNRYGRKTGFVCYCLRYWLVQNWGRNLNVTEAEFFALVATVMGASHPSQYQLINIRPTPRCVSLGNWFQNIYRYAYLFLGKILHLCHEFPSPAEIFSGAIWTAFYVCCKSDAWNASLQSVPMDQLYWAESQMYQIIREKRHMLRYITEGVFEFDDRY